jgi:uncharacterized protein (TIGR02611 family)
MLAEPENPDGTDLRRPTLKDRYRRYRHGLRRNPATDRAWRTGVGIAGGVVVIAGIIMIPYPGPGWLVLLAGLALLATEFERAQRVLTFVRTRYAR